ncbi:CRISPR-associated endoribonuclease Cas6 [Pedobacter sp. BS3]|uniref:CRISPR-associated endoribonuclease Cas6 n=1 Tax=Pedobacter sp. BS3 TaxID=2567937 RepID=UPI0011EEA000|nr:CRISPR-associated endoribonuclease Cas6 [Pedobacter sp. BS3]TZF81280.1 CRISPR-associated endoribonuclease Cas6 [Pedobacter sp. BS3]
MRFKIVLSALRPGVVIPINYQYILSSAIYRIITKGDSAYAGFLHTSGYGKGFKLFTFSQISCPFKIAGDRLQLLGDELSFQVAFHLPPAAENFVKGLFQSEHIDIADKRSKATFSVRSVESLPDPLQGYKDNVVINIQLKPLSPVVAGLQNEKGNYVFLSPDDARFADSLIYNWRNKIATCYDEATAAAALLMMEVTPLKQPFKSRLIAIKAGTPQETKIRGWMNFGLKVTGEKRFVEILMNAGCGVYNSQGMGFVELLK